MVNIQDLWLTYPGAASPSVKGVSIQIEAGEFLTLLGPSGCGKTSTLRSVAGLETPTGGSITIGSTRVFGDEGRCNIPTHARDIAMVFQSYAIWPHMTVGQNVAFPLDVAGTPGDESRRRVADVLDMVGLREYAERSATQLSGGQQQRVAIARALVRRSSVMLLDEPLSNLDAKLREQMRVELRDLLKRVGMTAIYVTHDQEEALMLSDRIALMQGGRLIESGTPRSLYLEPTTVFGATFLGAAEVIAVTARHGNRVDTAIGALQLERVLPDLTHVAIRPEAIVIEPAAGASPTSDGINRMPATLTSVVFSGRHQQLVLELPGGRRLNAQVDATRPFTAGDAVVVALPPSRLMPLLEDSAA